MELSVSKPNSNLVGLF